MYILNWLKKPYFFISSPKFNLFLSFGIGLFIFLFLYLFQPFNIYETLNNKLIGTAGFGLVTFIFQSFFFIILPLFFRDYFKNENWTVGKNVLFLLLLTIAITFGNFYYNSLIQSRDTIDLLSLQKFFFYTFSIAIFPILVFTLVSEKLYRLFREINSRKIMKLKISLPVKKRNEEIKILGENEKENVIFNIDDLIYVNSQGNYASFYMYSNNGLEEKILRSTLTNIATKLKNHTSIIRCHKSYIINSKYMNSISGNARGYFLESNLLDVQIPISRSYKKDKLKNLIS